MSISSTSEPQQQQSQLAVLWSSVSFNHLLSSQIHAFENIRELHAMLGLRPRMLHLLRRPHKRKKEGFQVGGLDRKRVNPSKTVGKTQTQQLERYRAGTR